MVRRAADRTRDAGRALLLPRLPLRLPLLPMLVLRRLMGGRTCMAPGALAGSLARLESGG